MSESSLEVHDHAGVKPVSSANGARKSLEHYQNLLGREYQAARKSMLICVFAETGIVYLW